MTVRTISAALSQGEREVRGASGFKIGQVTVQEKKHNFGWRRGGKGGGGVLQRCLYNLPLGLIQTHSFGFVVNLS